MREELAKSAVIYARVSSRKQVKEGTGIVSQATRCRAYAQSRGYEIVAMFTDDMTGQNTRRPGMDAMLSFLRQHEANPHVVLIDDISRLARGLTAHIELRDELARAGGILESPSVVFGDDADSQVLENVLASSAQHFAQKNREQTINRMKARLMNGYYVNASPPLGYRYIKGHGKELVRDEPMASIVQDTLEDLASARFGSQGEVRQFLEAQPEFPRNGKGEVSHQRANDLLTQPVYAGMIKAPSWVDCADCDKPLTACWSKGKTKRCLYYLCFNKECANYRKSIAPGTLEKEVEEVLAQFQQSRNLFEVASRVFRDLWDHMALSNQARQTRLKADLGRLRKQYGAPSGQDCPTRTTR